MERTCPGISISVPAASLVRRNQRNIIRKAKCSGMTYLQRIMPLAFNLANVEFCSRCLRFATSLGEGNA
jgi:hypothetical protein